MFKERKQIKAGLKALRKEIEAEPIPRELVTPEQARKAIEKGKKNKS